MKVSNFVCAVLFSLFSVSAFGQGQSLDQREAAIAARKAALAEKQREARIAAEEAELTRQEAALAQGQTPQTAEQAAPAAEQAKPGWKKMFSPIGRAIRNGSDAVQKQVEVTVTEVGNPTIRATTDDGVARYCNPNVLDRKVEVNGTKAKIKKDHFAACSTVAPATVASNASAAPTDYVSLRGNAVQTVAMPASNGGTAVSVTLSRGGMIAMEEGGNRRRWKCKPTAEDRRRPGTGVLVAWTATWSEKDRTERGCEEMSQPMMPK